MVQTVYWGSSDYMINGSDRATITQAKEQYINHKSNEAH